MAFRKYLAFTVVVIMMTILSGCEKELDFEYHDIEALPVIEGCLTQTQASVSISWTTPMDEPFDTLYVKDADVMLTDLTSGESYTVSANADGVYQRDMTGVPGHNYRISVFIEGKTYTSESVMLSPVVILGLQFFWIKMPGDDMAALQIRFTDNPLTPDYYWVRLYRNGKPYAWSVITDQTSVDGIIEEVVTTTHRDEKQEDEKQLLRDDDEVKVSVIPISRSMFNYLNAIMADSNGAPQYYGDKCLGYFLTSPIASSTIKYHPDEISYAQ